MSNTDLDRDPQVVETATGILELLTCPYFRQTGDKTCVSGCYDEPACQTSPPSLDEIVDSLNALVEVALAARNLTECAFMSDRYVAARERVLRLLDGLEVPEGGQVEEANNSAEARKDGG